MFISIETHWVQFRCWRKHSSATIHCGLVGGGTKKLLLKSMFSEKQWLEKRWIPFVKNFSQVFILSVHYDRKIANPGDKHWFLMTAVCLHKARPCLPTVLCAYFLFEHDANRERWVNFWFGSCTFLQFQSKCDVASDRLNSYFSLIQHYFCIFIHNCKRSDHY